MTRPGTQRKTLALEDELKQRRAYADWIGFFFDKSVSRAEREPMDLVRNAVLILRAKTARTDKVKREALEGSNLTAYINERLAALRTDDHERDHLLAAMPGADATLPTAMKVRQIREFVKASRPAASSAALGRAEEVTRKPAKVPLPVAYIVVQYLIHHGFLQTTGRSNEPMAQAAALADALMQFFGSTNSTRTFLPAQLAGEYLLYRQSAHWPGRYVKGKLSVKPIELIDEPARSRNPKEFALFTQEVHVHHGEDGSSKAMETYVGVMSRKSGYPFILSSITGGTMRERGGPRFTLIHSTVFEEDLRGRAASMTGVTLSPFGMRHAWTSTVCLERSERVIEHDELGIFAAEEQDKLGRSRIPPSVVARLMQHSPSGTNL